MTTTVAESHRTGRLIGVDAARGIALLGMMSVHVLPDGGGAHVGAFHLLFDGRASALFAVLAGVGISLSTGREAPLRGAGLTLARRRIAVRAAVIAVLGLTLGGVPTPAAVILVYYGVLFLVALPVLGWTARRLAVAAALVALLTPVLSQGLRLLLFTGEVAAGPNVSWSSLDQPGDVVSSVLLTGYYPVLTWTAYLLAGMAAGRLPLRSAAVVRRLTVIGLALALAGTLAAVAGTWAAGGAAGVLRRGDVSLASGEDAGVALFQHFHGTTPVSSWWWLVAGSPHSGTPSDLVHTVGTAMLVLGLMLMVARRLSPDGSHRTVLTPLVAAGSMTLTLYFAHVVALGFGRDRFADTSGTVLAVHVVLALVVATAWGAPRRRGPLEALVAMTVEAATGEDDVPAVVGPRPDRDGPRPDRDGPRPDRDGPRPDRDGPRPDRDGPRPDRDGPRPDRDGPRPDRDGPRPDGDGPGAGRDDVQPGGGGGRRAP